MSRTTDMALREVVKSEFYFHGNALEVRNAVIIWKNFSGKPNNFGNTAKEFNLVLSPEVATKLDADGWKVKDVESQDADGNVQHLYVVSIKVNFRVNADGTTNPEINLYSQWNGNRSKRQLTEESVNILDTVNFESADCVINPYMSKMRPGKVTGYLNILNVIQEQAINFGGKYDDWEDANTASDELPFPTL